MAILQSLNRWGKVHGKVDERWTDGNLSTGEISAKRRNAVAYEDWELSYADHGVLRKAASRH